VPARASRAVARHYSGGYCSVAPPPLALLGGGGPPTTTTVARRRHRSDDVILDVPAEPAVSTAAVAGGPATETEPGDTDSTTDDRSRKSPSCR